MARRLKLVASMNIVGAEEEGDCDLPDDWDEMTEEQQDAWAGEALENHRNNCDTSYWEVIDD